MDRPLWRIFLHIALLAFVAQRGAAAAMLILSDASPLLIIAAVSAGLAGLFASWAIWTGRATSGALIALAVVLVAGALLHVIALGARAAPGAIAQAMAGVLAALGVRWFIQRAEADR
jgi:hypothetical protein